jgi:endonuclease/exonuclease/phosphatase (EEP) superfamily protein YafD
MERASRLGVSWLRLAVVVAATAYVAAVTLLLLASAVVTPRGGIPAILVIFGPQLALAGLLLAPLALLREADALRGAFAALAIAVAVRLGDEWLSPPPASSPDVEIASWNLERGAREPADGLDALGEIDVDFVALQELTPDQAAAIEADPTLGRRYPHHALAPDPTVLGLGILSRHPISASESFADPVVLVARVGVGGRSLTVVNVHPLPARIAQVRGVPVDFDPQKRDRDLRAIRARVDAAIARGETVLLVGDFNVVPTEVAWRELSDGLRDAHLMAGVGPGWTWRPGRLETLEAGLLRIDAALAGPGLLPVETSVDCSRLGDHCLLQAGFAFE